MLIRQFVILFATLFGFAAALCAQSDAPASANPAPAARVDYPDSTSGLEHLAKDILKAQKDDAGARADALTKSMILPNPVDWYQAVFRNKRVGGYYTKLAPGIAPYLAKAFLTAQSQGYSRVEACRFENSCDDNAPENAYNMLLRRKELIAIYELRLLKNDQFTRIFPIAYVDGAFRFLLDLDYQPPRVEGDKTETTSEDTAQDSSVPRMRVGAKVQSAKLINRVQPVYPQVAKDEHLQGTVTIHAIIAKDGSIGQIERVLGRCSLAQSALEAVRHWRYTPTLLNGDPVEVDTQISVIFELRQ